MSSPEAIERLAADFIHRPYELYARLRAEGPVKEIVMPHGVKVWIVTRYDDVRMLLADDRVSKDGRRVNQLYARHSGADESSTSFNDDLTAHMLNSDPPKHTRLRKLVAREFTTRRVEQIRSRIVAMVDELLDRMEERDEVDLVADYAVPIPITVIAELLGIPADDRALFLGWATTLVGADHAPEEVEAASTAVIDYAKQLMERKRAQPQDDLLSGLVHATDDGESMSEAELVAMFFLLVVAGQEASTHMIGNSILALLRNPEQLAKLTGAPELYGSAFDELMRYDSPVSIASFRFTKEPIPLSDGVTIPAEEILVLSLGSAGRDPHKFEQPEVLDVTRKHTGVLSFGHGVHYCVGAPLARMEVEIALRRLFERYPELRLARQPQELRYRNSTLMRGLTALPVATK
ncbi:cytochrome P450 [Kitasatospora sp. GAS204B]|uniref:cytochrome P450 family protein n=1 Tax=unclassified Kitasatospora TaxID=2633591 RepID=UPI002473B734|nr:cytochrome P450 [Kitasatospora sp. GAS204B]MDH6122603.1 cytochrome P450 [Kitasatospora sp. GAS204B]